MTTDSSLVGTNTIRSSSSPLDNFIIPLCDVAADATVGTAALGACSCMLSLSLPLSYKQQPVAVAMR